MPIHARTIVKLAALLLLVTILVGSGLIQGTAYAALPTTPCSSSGPGTVSCDLFAEEGSITLPGTSGNVPIWGYATTDGGTPEMPGPVLIVNQNDVVTVHLTNNLQEATGLNFVGIDMIPDFTGVGAAAATDYTFTASRPGTYLYEAGLLPNTQHQVAMGLFGVLVVRPATPNQAYGAAISAYDDESLVVLSELDTNLNTSADPSLFDMRDYKPAYAMINGQVSPNTLAIATAPSSDHLLRYANAGLQPHSMGALGLRQLEIAVDGSPYTYPRSVVAEIIAPGQTADMLLSIPALAPTQAAKFAIYDSSMTLHNSNAGFGGMLTFLSVAPSIVPSDNTGPATTQVSLSPNRTAGLVNPVAIAATVTDGGSVVNNVVAAEYFIDAVGANGTGAAMTGPFGSSSVAVQGTLSVLDMSALSSGNHTLYIHGLDDAGNWGPTNFAVLNLDRTGPKSSGLGLTPNPSNGTVDVVLTATGNDSANGNSFVAEAEYLVTNSAQDVLISGSMALNKSDAQIASLSAVIAQADINALVHGAYQVIVRSRDDLGNWGADSQSIPLFVDKIGPSVSAGLPPVNPSPNNGKLPLSSSQASIRVNATLSEVDILAQFGYASDALEGSANILVFLPSIAGGSATIADTVSSDMHIFLPSLAGGNADVAEVQSSEVDAEAAAAAANCRLCVRKAEAFIDTLGAPGTGVQLTANDGLFDELVEPANVLIPLINLAQLTEGSHTIYVRGQDGAGNWGSPPIELTLVIDKQAPTLSGLTATFDTSGNLLISFTANDISAIGAAEYFIDATGVTGSGVAMTVNGNTVNATIPAATVSALTPGSHTLYVHAKDVAGNWSAFANTSFINDRIFADSFESNSFAPWSGTSTGSATRLSVNPNAAMVGTYGMRALIGNSNFNNNYVQYSFNTNAPIFDTRFYFRPQGQPASGINNNIGGITIFQAATSGNFNTTVFTVRYRTQGGVPQVQIRIGNTNNNTWTNVNYASSNTIEVVWERANSGGPNPGTLRLRVNGVLIQSLPTNSNNAVGAFRMGAVTNSNTGPDTYLYFDEFAAKRTATPLYVP